MRSSFVLLLFLSFALPGLNHETARAQTNDAPSTAELLTYSELMNLSRDRQIQYLEGVRAILVDLSKNPDGRISDRDLAARSKLKAWLDWMNGEVKAASAQQQEATKPASSPCIKNAACADKLYECYNRRIGVMWDEKSGAYACDDKRTIETVHKTSMSFSFSNKKRVLKALGETVEDPRRAPRTQGPIVLPDAVTPTELAAAKASQIDSAPDETKPNDLAAAIRASREMGPSKAFPGLNVQSEGPMSVAPAVPVNAPPSDSPAAVITNEERPSPVESQPEVTSPTDATEIASPRSAPRARAPREKRVARTTATDLSKYTCAPKPDVCENPKIAREKVFQGNLACVFAGMISKLDSRNRKCEAVTEFKLGEATYKCASGQTMCNPLLFGTVSATKAICVGRGNNVTEQCGKLSSAHDAEVFLNRNESGLQDRWDEFRTEFAKICKPGTPQAKFHCVECNVMKARIFELHARLVGDPCKPGVSTFDGAVKERIRSRSGPTRK